MPIYVARPKDADPQSTEGVRLIQAKNPAAVARHIAASYALSIVKGTEGIELAQSGVKLETAD